LSRELVGQNLPGDAGDGVVEGFMGEKDEGGFENSAKQAEKRNRHHGEFHHHHPFAAAGQASEHAPASRRRDRLALSGPVHKLIHDRNS